MKRRRLRSLFTLLTVMIITIALVLFLSLSAIQIAKPATEARELMYEGIYIKDPSWNTIGENIVDALRARYSDKADILSRSWLYTFFPADNDFRYKVQYGSKSCEYYAALGLTPEEERLPWVNLSLIEGRWFTSSDEEVCILPDYIADKLNVRIGEKVTTLGKNLTVVGVVNSVTMDSFKDLDGQLITPFDKTILGQDYVHVTSKIVLILPYDILLPYDRIIASVSVVAENSTLVPTIGQEIFQNFPEIYLLQGVDGKLTTYYLATSYTLTGWQMQLVPLVISCFMLFNLMLGSVQERTKEIFVFSSVGLSPIQVAFMFLAESAVYAVLGSVLGYVAGMGIGLIASAYPGMVPLNYSSTWVVMSNGFIMLATIVSVLYPLYKASRLVTPSLERVWTPPTKPLGDRWSVPLPFIYSEEGEVLGLRGYLIEFLQTYGGEAAEFSASDISRTDELNSHVLSMNVRLAPYDEGITQRVGIAFNRNPENRWNVELTISRKTGSIDAWARLNRRFMDQFRKQFLIWRSLEPSQRLKHIQEAEK